MDTTHKFNYENHIPSVSSFFSQSFFISLKSLRCTFKLSFLFFNLAAHYLHLPFLFATFFLLFNLTTNTAGCFFIRRRSPLVGSHNHFVYATIPKVVFLSVLHTPIDYSNNI